MSRDEGLQQVRNAYQTFLPENKVVLDRINAITNESPHSAIKSCKSLNGTSRTSAINPLREVQNAAVATSSPIKSRSASDWATIRSQLRQHGGLPSNTQQENVATPKLKTSPTDNTPVVLPSASGNSCQELALHAPSREAASDNETWSMSGMVDSVSDAVLSFGQTEGKDIPVREDYPVQERHESHAATFDTPDERDSEGNLINLTSASWVWKWLVGVPEGPKVPFIVKGAERMWPQFRQCDIDTDSGMPVPAIQQLPTLPHQRSGSGDEDTAIRWRQETLTSNLHIGREIKCREKLARTIKSRLQSQTQQQVKASEEEDDAWPTANCIVRPAEPRDFEAIAAIMNAESKADKSPQLFETVNVKVVEDLYQHCRETLRPFVVAVPSADELLDRSKWPKGADKAYQEYLQFRKSVPIKKIQVAGFAVLTDMRVGFSNAPCPGSRHTGLIKLAVDPEYRQQLYGSALLDRILLCVAAHRTVVEYKWDCVEPGLVYERVYTHNRRQYTQVYIEVFSVGKDDAELSWRTKMLDKFEFRQVAYLPEAVKTDRHHQSRWMDLSLWQLDAQPASKIADKSVGGFLNE